MRRITLFVVALVCPGTIALAQRNKAIDQKRLLKMRDDLDNLLVANKAGSAILVKQGEVELYSFNSFLSCEKLYDKNGNNANLRGNLIQFSSQLQFNVGLSKTRWINVGADVIYTSYRQDLTGKSSVFSIFEGIRGMSALLPMLGHGVEYNRSGAYTTLVIRRISGFPLQAMHARGCWEAVRLTGEHSFFFYKYYNQKWEYLRRQILHSHFLPGAKTSWMFLRRKTIKPNFICLCVLQRVMLY